VQQLSADGATVAVTDRHERRTCEVTEANRANYPQPDVGDHVLDVGRGKGHRPCRRRRRVELSHAVNNATDKLAGPWDYDLERLDRTMAV
jgi:hypothetical protein